MRHQVDGLDRVALPFVRARLSTSLDAAECVDADGRTSLWLLVEDDAGSPGCACRTCAPHEADGPMSRALRERLGLLGRCQALTVSGAPCRVIVPVGARCPRHQARA